MTTEMSPKELDEYNLFYLSKFLEADKSPDKEELKMSPSHYHHIQLRRLINVARILESYGYLESVEETIDFFSCSICRRVMVNTQYTILNAKIQNPEDGEENG